MDKILPVWGNTMGCRLLEPHELQERTPPVNQQLSDLFSNQALFFNPEQSLNSFSFGINNAIQQLDQSAGLLNGDQNQGFQQLPGNGQCTVDTGTVIVTPEEDRESQWQRIRWTDEMVKVLIKAVSYVVKALSDYEQGQLSVPIKGKWRAVSNAMVGKGYTVSPQQCEDKFNDINRKYKRLNDILGSVSCDVVQNPVLLNSVLISDEAKDEVRRILACRQLFYQEMCSYHNWNREHLPHDKSLEQAVISALTGVDKPQLQNMNLEPPTKRQKRHNDNEAPAPAPTPNAGEDQNTDTTTALPRVDEEQRKAVLATNQELSSQALVLKEKRLQIQKEMLALEKRRIEWLKFCEKQDRKLHKVTVENRLMKLENEQMLVDLRDREISIDHNSCPLR